jgi:hypothetical protein
VPGEEATPLPHEHTVGGRLRGGQRLYCVCAQPGRDSRWRQSRHRQGERVGHCREQAEPGEGEGRRHWKLHVQAGSDAARKEEEGGTVGHDLVARATRGKHGGHSELGDDAGLRDGDRGAGHDGSFLCFWNNMVTEKSCFVQSAFSAKMAKVIWILAKEIFPSSQGQSLFCALLQTSGN